MRHIDWNVTARMDEPYVREFAEDREIAAWLLIDRTPSMTLGPAGRTKERLAVELAVSLARLLGRGGNRVGAMVLTEGPPAVIRARRGSPPDAADRVGAAPSGRAGARRYRPRAVAPSRRGGAQASVGGLHPVGLRDGARVGARPADAGPPPRPHRDRGDRPLRAPAARHRRGDRRGRRDRRPGGDRHRQRRLPTAPRRAGRRAKSPRSTR